MKILDRRIRRLEAKFLNAQENEPKSDDVHPGVWIRMDRLLGKDLRYNRVEHLRSERLASADVNYCRKMLERQNRQDLREASEINTGHHENRETHEAVSKLVQVMARQPIVERLCALYGFDEEEAEGRITRAQAVAEARGFEGLSVTELILEAFRSGEG